MQQRSPVTGATTYTQERPSRRGVSTIHATVKTTQKFGIGARAKHQAAPYEQDGQGAAPPEGDALVVGVGVGDEEVTADVDGLAGDVVGAGVLGPAGAVDGDALGGVLAAGAVDGCALVERTGAADGCALDGGAPDEPEADATTAGDNVGAVVSAASGPQYPPRKTDAGPLGAVVSAAPGPQSPPRKTDAVPLGVGVVGGRVGAACRSSGSGGSVGVTPGALISSAARPGPGRGAALS